MTRRFAVLLAIAGCALAGCGDGLVAETNVVLSRNAAATTTTVQRLSHRIIDGMPSRLEVDIAVANLGYHKEVGIHASIDGGPWSDALGSFVASRGDGTETWLVALDLPASFARVDYVAFYRDPSSGQAYWDNNGSRNYQAGAADVAWAGHDLSSGTLAVDVDVRNKAYEKACFVYITGDGWMSWTTAGKSRYVGPTQRAGIERWRIAADEKTLPILKSAATLEFTVACDFSPSDYRSTRALDDNYGRNYRIERRAGARKLWESPFDAPLAVRLAPDGTAFVLATSNPPSGSAPGSKRWISVYAPSGAWLGVVELPVDVQRMEYLPKADVLLVQAWSAAQSRWFAVSKTGATLWDLTADLPILVLAPNAEYLLGPAGRSALSSSAPAIDPALRCADPSPLLARNGLVACRQNGGLETLDVPAGKTLAQSAAEGEPWALGEDGTLVLKAPADPMTGGYYSKELRAYDRAGKKLWTRAGLQMAPSSLVSCANHAVGQHIAYNQPDAAGSTGTLTVADVASGQTLRTTKAPSPYAQACPRDDGFFYWRPDYEKYWTTWYRMSASADVQALSLGPSGTLQRARPAGEILFSHVAKGPSSWTETAAKVVLWGPTGEELFLHTFDNPSGNFVVADAAANRVVVVGGGKVLSFER